MLLQRCRYCPHHPYLLHIYTYSHWISFTHLSLFLKWKWNASSLNCKSFSLVYWHIIIENKYLILSYFLGFFCFILFSFSLQPLLNFLHPILKTKIHLILDNIRIVSNLFCISHSHRRKHREHESRMYVRKTKLN